MLTNRQLFNSRCFIFSQGNNNNLHVNFITFLEGCRFVGKSKFKLSIIKNQVIDVRDDFLAFTRNPSLPPSSIICHLQHRLSELSDGKQIRALYIMYYDVRENSFLVVGISNSWF